MPDAVYNVCCTNCDAVWQPAPRSPRWWQAKQKADKGYLDALYVSGEKCGCDRSPKESGKPFEVFGYTDDCRDFRWGFDTFVGAVRAFREADMSGCVVFIKGLSPATEHRLQYGC